MHHAQNLQKIFPVAEGDHAQGPSCSVEREYCPHYHKGPVPTCHLPTIDHQLPKEQPHQLYPFLSPSLAIASRQEQLSGCMK
ncbi:MAG: hypothetical protein ACJ8DI_20060, partial [Ktedonobacteraceae bacterium]